MSTTTWNNILLLALAWLLFSGGIGVPGLSQKADHVTYVYEKDGTAVPDAVKAAISKLNDREGLVADTAEDDEVDANGNIPAAVVEARKAGEPCLVVMGGGKLIRVVKDPKTEDDVLKAVP